MFKPGWYKVFASGIGQRDSTVLRPSLITFGVTIRRPNNLIGDYLKGTHYLGRFRLTEKAPYLTVKFDNETPDILSFTSLQEDWMMRIKLANSNNDIIRDIYPDGQVNLRRK